LRLLYETLVFENGRYVLVAGNQPHVMTIWQRYAVDRVVRAQSGIGRVGICFEGRVE
jgi:hypothetical protein